MSSFISRFNSKKTSESPVTISRNANGHGAASTGPIKANSAAIFNQSRNQPGGGGGLNGSYIANPSGGHATTTTGMYVIQTEMDIQNKKHQHNKEQHLLTQIEQLKD